MDQLAHRRAGVPEKTTVEELTSEQSRVESAIVDAETEVSDLGRAQRKADADVEQVRARRARDEQRMNAGQVSSPKELESLQHEVDALIRRQSELEDVELEIMERLEVATTRRSELAETSSSVGRRLEDAKTALADAYGKIDSEQRDIQAKRAELATEIDGPLIELYERLRKQHSGIGAAALSGNRCEGCRMELDTTFVAKIKSSAPDLVVRCEECSRILVRTK